MKKHPSKKSVCITNRETERSLSNERWITIYFTEKLTNTKKKRISVHIRILYNSLAKFDINIIKTIIAIFKNLKKTNIFWIILFLILCLLKIYSERFFDKNKENSFFFLFLAFYLVFTNISSLFLPLSDICIKYYRFGLLDKAFLTLFGLF